MKYNILHLKAPENWINDPNGFIYYKGKYHLFYQYFPYGTRWGTMHWGHAVSDDLVRWEHLDIAIYPSENYDINGIFSGSAIEKDGNLYIYYTAEKYIEPDPEDIHLPKDGLAIESQAMMISPDGTVFENSSKAQIIAPIEDESIADKADCRDPKVFAEDGKYYMCLGSTYKKREGILAIFESEDAIKWRYSCGLRDRELGIILECPDLFCVDGRHILVGSAIGICENEAYANQQTIIRFMKMDLDNGIVKYDGQYRYLDYGMDIYAPQSNLDENGRRTMIAWVRMPHPVDAKYNTASEAKPWIGMMTLPRVIEVRDDHIYTRIHPSVREYFEKNGVREYKNIDNLTDDNVKRQYTECRVDDNIQIKLLLRNKEQITIYGFVIKMTDGHIESDRDCVIDPGTDIHRICKTPYVGEECELEIYMEANLVEIYINDGQYVITNYIDRLSNIETE